MFLPRYITNESSHPKQPNTNSNTNSTVCVCWHLLLELNHTKCDLELKAGIYACRVVCCSLCAVFCVPCAVGGLDGEPGVVGSGVVEGHGRGWGARCGGAFVQTCAVDNGRGVVC